MADRWMDERDRQWRDRDWRRSESYGRGGDYGGEDYTANEDRSFQSYEDGGEHGGYGGGHGDRDRERDEDFRGRSRVSSGGGAYGAGGSYGGGESYGRAGGRPSAYQGQRSQAPRFGQQDYTGGGRYYGDDRRQPIYREEYGQGGREYGDVPRGYDAGRYGERGDMDRDLDQGHGRRVGPAYGGSASGGVGGYDFERGYGDAGRREYRGDQERWLRHERDERRGGGREEQFEDRARDAGQSLRQVGQKISSWFRGDRYLDQSGEEGRDDERRDFREDFGRERRFEPQGRHEGGQRADERGFRGMGPKNWRRSDERINEEVHDRLTDDPWLDASHIEVAVKDGEVTLSGTVEDRQSKHRAERIVEDLSGVSHVQNNLRVLAADPLTGSGRGFGSSALEAEMRRNAAGADPGDNGASGLSGRTSTGALAERSHGTATDQSIDPLTGEKK